MGPFDAHIQANNYRIVLEGEFAIKRGLRKHWRHLKVLICFFYKFRNQIVLHMKQTIIMREKNRRVIDYNSFALFRMITYINELPSVDWSKNLSQTSISCLARTLASFIKPRPRQQRERHPTSFPGLFPWRWKSPGNEVERRLVQLKRKLNNPTESPTESPVPGPSPRRLSYRKWHRLYFRSCSKKQRQDGSDESYQVSIRQIVFNKLSCGEWKWFQPGASQVSGDLFCLCRRVFENCLILKDT